MRTEDMDREFDDLRKRMQSYEEQPDEALWKNILKKMGGKFLGYNTITSEKENTKNLTGVNVNFGNVMITMTMGLR